QDDDREELRELEKNNKSDQTAVSPLEVPSPKKAKVSPKAEVAEKGSVSVEYAKSARSTCKACNASIAKGALRIGVSAHDPRGFDSTKWYHVACFPASSHLLGPVEEVQGFDSIKDDDREELQELEKNNKRDQTAVSPLEVPSPKKAKVLPKAEVAEKGSVSVEYAKSARSTCKACNASITKGALRIGVSAHDPRGFDSTKWYHVACFPTSSHPLGRVEKLKGFDSIKDDDREELRELEKNKKGDQAAVGPVELSSPNKGNSHISLPEVEVAE
uniref:PARP-type domain-containing protein n=1 Tax=Aegilops tauschii subsp. strangulata TaxID=200361 RepID=A0A453FGH2_AEGTS